MKASEAVTDRESEIERTRLAMMRHYAEHEGCRRSFLLTYFGQDYPGPCGNCDNDLATHAAARRPEPAGRAVPGRRPGGERALGPGHRPALRRRPVTVLFDEHGYRELYLPVVREHGLLRPA